MSLKETKTKIVKNDLYESAIIKNTSTLVPWFQSFLLFLKKNFFCKQKALWWCFPHPTDALGSVVLLWV